jgi:hypothetical protein
MRPYLIRQPRPRLCQYLTQLSIASGGSPTKWPPPLAYAMDAWASILIAYQKSSNSGTFPIRTKNVGGLTSPEFVSSVII